MIFDYTQYNKFEAHYGEGFESKNRDLIDVHNTKCPFCGSVLVQKFFYQRYDTNIMSKQSVDQWETIYNCENDGWWQHKISERQDVDPKAWYSVIHEGTLARYGDNSLDVPIDVLNVYISKHPEKIFSIHDKKMEELVASVFRSFYNCEATVVGKSSDGGIDIILLENDSPIGALLLCMAQEAKDTLYLKFLYNQV